MTPEERLADLGLTLPDVPVPAGSYVPAIKTGAYVYTAGQVPRAGGGLQATGKVGADVDLELAGQLARTCTLSCLAAVKSVVGELSSVVRVVKVVVFVASAPDFTGQPQVANGASDLLGEVFGPEGTHARSAVGVAVLPLDAPVEVEMIVEAR